MTKLNKSDSICHNLEFSTLHPQQRVIWKHKWCFWHWWVTHTAGFWLQHSLMRTLLMGFRSVRVMEPLLKLTLALSFCSVPLWTCNLQQSSCRVYKLNPQKVCVLCKSIRRTGHRSPLGNCCTHQADDACWPEHTEPLFPKLFTVSGFMPSVGK